jgi:DinB superfamily
MAMDAGTLRRWIGEGYDRKAWHGPNLRSALRGVGPGEALWRPGPGRHSIWEIALHCAYWKHRVTVRVTGESTKFGRRGADWPVLPAEPDEGAWRADLALLGSVHAALLAACDGGLTARPAGRAGRSPVDQLVGIAFHDVYHAGQIRLIRRMYRDRAK